MVFSWFLGASKPPKTKKKPGCQMKVKQSVVIFRLPKNFDKIYKKVIESQILEQTSPGAILEIF
jgi:hypothetical protein